MKTIKIFAKYFTKVQESFAVRRKYDDTVGKTSDSQYGGIPRTSTINAAVKLTHKSHEVQMHTVIRIVFLDFLKAFDLIDHNKLLENMNEMCVRSALTSICVVLERTISFLIVFENDFENVTGGVPQGSKLGSIAFVVKINMLPSVIDQVVAQGENDDVVLDEDTILFMDGTTSWEH